MRDFDLVINALASLLEYPDANFQKRLSTCTSLLHTTYPKLFPERIFEPLERLSLEDLEELFTQTFELSPTCVPYVSVHLFGEGNHKRGEFMARLNQRYGQLGFNCGKELPDHLNVLLRFLTIADQAESRELVEYCLLAPLRQMGQSLPDGNPYATVLRAIQTVLEAEFVNMAPAPLPASPPRSL